MTKKSKIAIFGAVLHIDKGLINNSFLHNFIYSESRHIVLTL